jgi:hypothetical protein
MAHPNEALIGQDEAQLVINVGRSLLTYLDGKLAACPPPNASALDESGNVVI